MNVKRGVLGIFIIVLFVFTQVGAVSYERVSYVNDNVEVFVEITANTPWSSPYSETVNVSIDVVPNIENVLGVNITSMTLIVHRAEPDGSSYILINIEKDDSANIVSPNPYANYTNSFTVSERSTGTECYFKLVVEGRYGNGTHFFDFQSMSPDDLVGPFAISPSITTPTVWVGLLVLGVAGIIFIAGIKGIKKSRSRVRRKSLLDD